MNFTNLCKNFENYVKLCKLVNWRKMLKKNKNKILKI